MENFGSTSVFIRAVHAWITPVAIVERPGEFVVL